MNVVKEISDEWMAEQERVKQAEYDTAAAQAQKFADATGMPYYVVTSKNYNGYNVIPAYYVEDRKTCEENAWTPIRVYSRAPV